MSFWRNPEIKRQAAAYLVFAAAWLVAAYLAATWLFGAESWQTYRTALAAVCGFTAAALITGGAFLLAGTAARYRRLSGLAEELDRFLHGGEGPEFSQQKEGELAILRDEIRKLMLALKKQAGELEAERTFLCDAITDMSHQLRTPLTSLNLVQTMLTEPGLSEERRQELTGQLRFFLRRIDELLVVLLKMARIEAGAVSFAREPVPVERLVEQAAQAVAIPMELRGQELTCQGDSRASFDGDLGWSAEALGNILKNCMEHTPEGGHIRVLWEENAVYTGLCVEDDGPGIAAEDLPHILERFYKGRERGGEGFGVGLAFARMVFAGQNGVLRAENRREGGARFTVRFYKSVL